MIDVILVTRGEARIVTGLVVLALAFLVGAVILLLRAAWWVLSSLLTRADARVRLTVAYRGVSRMVTPERARRDHAKRIESLRPLDRYLRIERAKRDAAINPIVIPGVADIEQARHRQEDEEEKEAR